jgi:3',5'-cyclic AMP phosphodiesterase CpdA
VIAISGDFTQRARTHEFELARDFLRTLPSPVIVVPGNHDVPLYSPLSRWLQPLHRYKRFISDDLHPSYVDEEIAIVGINTARSFTFKNGRINEQQIERACQCLRAAPNGAIRIVVAHHPFDLANPGSSDAVVGRANMAMRGLVGCSVDLVLSGHYHKTHTTSSAERYKIDGRPVLLVHAGTATSTRQRGEVNSCNLLRIEPSGMEIECFRWTPGAKRFDSEKRDRFSNEASTGWTVANLG